MLDASTIRRAEQVLALCREAGIKVATVESCTGGMIAGVLTACAGSSDVVERGFITYSNEAKQDTLGVSLETLGTKGAVSEKVAREMAEGARLKHGADYALATTGIAGPAGGTEGKPVGTVFITLATRQGTQVLKECNHTDRETFKMVTTQQALNLLRQAIED